MYQKSALEVLELSLTISNISIISDKSTTMSGAYI